MTFSAARNHDFASQIDGFNGRGARSHHVVCGVESQLSA